ncbi:MULTISPECIES: hypothetical protein [unclassified Burkholderia]|uniref:hypothetical protein n=1 Tax=unclassified Burkholderia TaxID=2613784 RepID=UPI00141EEC7C|nr:MULTISPECIES: hypothetical protein [unclassified Burkholderia]NIF09546.1 hypothetical protein [Burkholderia sp. Ax-1735]NIG01529.1 hypothetical protein [Burkholderia sp. Tr-849]
MTKPRKFSDLRGFFFFGPVDGLVDNHAPLGTATRLPACDSTHAYDKRRQILRKYHTIIVQRVAMEQGSDAARAPVPLRFAFDTHAALLDVANCICDAIVMTPPRRSRHSPPQAA